MQHLKDKIDLLENQIQTLQQTASNLRRMIELSEKMSAVFMEYKALYDGQRTTCDEIAGLKVYNVYGGPCVDYHELYDEIGFSALHGKVNTISRDGQTLVPVCELAKLKRSRSKAIEQLVAAANAYLRDKDEKR